MTVQKNIGDSIQVVVNVQNTGDVAHLFYVVSWIGAAASNAMPVQLNVGEVGQATFAFTATAAGTFDAKAAVFAEQDLAAKLAEQTLPGEVVIQDLPVYAVDIISIEVV